MNRYRPSGHNPDATQMVSRHGVAQSNLYRCIVLLCSLLFVSPPPVLARGEGKKSAVLNGHITNAKTRQPVVAATVTIDERESRTAFSNTIGKFQLSGVSGKITLLFEATGFYSKKIQNIEVASGDTVVLNVKLQPIPNTIGRPCDTCAQSGAMVGTIIDRRRDEPIAGARIVVLSTGMHAISSKDGTFSLTNLSPGNNDLVVTHSDFYGDTIRQIETTSAGVTSVHIPLEPLIAPEDETGIISGRIVDEETGLALAAVSVSLLNTGYGAQTDSTGSFSLKLLPPGHYSLLATKWGFETRIQSGLIVRAKEEITAEVKLPTQTGSLNAELSDQGAIEGVVTNPSGEPFAGAMVLIEETGDWANSDYMGNFLIDSLPTGVYTAVAVAEGFSHTRAYDIDVWSGEVARTTIQLEEERLETAERAEVQPDPKAGTIVGVVVDAREGAPITGATIKLVDSRIKAVTNTNGRFILSKVPPGEHSIQAMQTGFEDRVFDHIQAEKNTVTTVDIILSKSDVTELQRMSVRASAPQSTGAALLKERQKAVSFTDAIGSQEMSRTGASNAADAMKSVTGATVVGGKYVLIRGLPDRYTITMLNGSPIPSPDPDRQAVNMDMFPAGMIENIITSKTFVPHLPADFAGGVVDIRTKPFPEKLTLSVGASTSLNTQVTFNPGFLTYEGGATDWLGFDDGTRAIPEIFNDYTKEEIDEFYGIPAGNFNSNYVLNRMNDPADAFMDSLLIYDQFARSLDTTMHPHTMVAPPDQSYSFALGNSFTLLDRPLGVRLGLSYGNSYDLSLDDIKRTWEFNRYDTDLGGYPGPILWNDYKETSADKTIHWGGIATAAYKINDEHTISADYLYTRNAIDHVGRIRGRYGYYTDMDDNPPWMFDTRRLHYTERSISWVQPGGKHTIRIGRVPTRLAWKGSYAGSMQNEPDLRNIYHFSRVIHDTTRYMFQANVGDPSRQWRNLKENAGSAALDFSIPFWQWSGDSGTISLGSLWFRKARQVRKRYLEYQLDQYMAFLSNYRPDIDQEFISSQDYVSPDHLGFIADSGIISGYRPGLLIRDQSESDAQWDGHSNILSAYLAVELPLFGRFSSTFGLRYEWANMFGQTIVKQYQSDSIAAKLNDHDVLPSVSLSFALRENMNLRSAYGRTLVRPSMREKAQYDEESFIGGPSFLGNAGLKRSLVDNMDLRWEWYMKPGELLAASAFYKIVQQPIEIRYVGANDTEQPINTPSDALVWGLEFEVRKQLDFVHILRHVQLAGNYTIARSRVELDSSLTDSSEMAKNYLYFPKEPNHRPFQGQSPYVINVFVTFNQPDWGTDINLIYNVFGERMAKLTDPNIAWLWEQPQHILNATASQKIGKHIAVKLKASNILGSSKKSIHHYAGGELLVSESFPGRSFSLGLNYTF